MAHFRSEPGTLGSVRITSTGSGMFQAEARLYDHQRQVRKLRARGSTPEAAIAAIRRRAEDELRSGHRSITRDSTLADAVAVWLANCDARGAALSQRTRELYRRQGESLAAAFGDLLLREIGPGECEALIARVRNERSASAASVTKKTLSLVLGVAARHGAIASNPVRDTSRLDGAEKIESSLTAAGYALVREWVKDWRLDQRGGTQPDRDLLLDAIAIMAGTSARPSEVLALRRCDVVLEDSSRAGTAVIRGKIVQVKGQGAVRENFPKQRRQSRTISLPEFAIAAVRRRLAICGASDETLLFETSAGRPRSVSNLERLLRTFRDDHADRIEREIGVPPSEFTCKLFRRTAASAVDQAEGTDLAALLLGHADPQTTRRHYAVRLPIVPSRTAAILDQALAPPEPDPQPTPAVEALPDNVVPFRRRR